MSETPRQGTDQTEGVLGVLHHPEGGTRYDRLVQSSPHTGTESYEVPRDTGSDNVSARMDDRTSFLESDEVELRTWQITLDPPPSLGYTYAKVEFNIDQGTKKIRFYHMLDRRSEPKESFYERDVKETLTVKCNCVSQDGLSSRATFKTKNGILLHHILKGTKYFVNDRWDHHAAESFIVNCKTMGHPVEGFSKDEMAMPSSSFLQMKDVPQQIPIQMIKDLIDTDRELPNENSEVRQLIRQKDWELQQPNILDTTIPGTLTTVEGERSSDAQLIIRLEYILELANQAPVGVTKGTCSTM